MDANRFDHLTRWVSAGGTRRRIVALLSVLPLGGMAELLAGDELAEAKRHKQKTKQRKQNARQRKRRTTATESIDDEAQPHKKHCRRVKGKGHGHHGRRKNCQAHHRPGSNKGKGKTPQCEPESLAQTCAGTCGSVQNNCQQSVDCGSCKCNPACPACQRCNEATTTCEPDPDQVGDDCGDGLLCQDDGQCACEGNSCGGCRACEAGRCVVDATILCTAQDQCHEAGVCYPQTGKCTNPAKADGTSCDDGDQCTTDNTCQSGVCTGTPKNCSTEGDICNDGVCRSSDGVCTKQPKQDGTGCNADNDSCTEGDSCQGGVCTAGAGVNCHSEDDECNDGICRSADGQCIKRARQNGTPCGDDGTCQAGVCQEAVCKALGNTCNPGNNRCCQDDPTSCAALAPNCYVGGEPQDERCCHQTRETCGTGCDCCGLADCEGGACCNYPGGACQAQADCCTGSVPATCVNSTCCVGEGDFCTEDADCCSGSCPDGFCTGCLALRQECESADECCQSGGQTLCRESFDFDSANCCRPKGGTCSGNNDCCEGRACNNGHCCEGENFVCESNNDCCSGLECRGGLCRSNTCRAAGEACPPGSPGCCPGNGSCSGGTCCHQIGETCVQTPQAGSPCCGNNTECGGDDGATCCIYDFAGALGEGGNCTSDDQCCSGHCNDTRKVCCRPQGAPCTEMGALNFECCIYEGLTCDGNGNGTCIPCRKLGQTCVSDGSDSTCCIGSHCENGVCTQSSCGIGGAPCQDASTCCPGSICSGGAACLKICQAEGEFCRCSGGICAPFPCCSGLTCSADEKCVQP